MNNTNTYSTLRKNASLATVAAAAVASTERHYKAPLSLLLVQQSY